jgi:hypothetical protein
MPRSREAASFAAVAPCGASACLVRARLLSFAAVAPCGAPACLVRVRLRCLCGRRSLWGAGMPRSLRQSSPAQKLARLSGRGRCVLLRASFPRRLRNSLCEACRAPFSATAAWRALNATRSIPSDALSAAAEPRGMQFAVRMHPSEGCFRWSNCTHHVRWLPNGHRYPSEGYPWSFDDTSTHGLNCHAVNPSATRRPQRPSGPALRGFGSREGGTNGVFGGGCRPRRATDESASEAGWSERVRAARGPRAREDECGAPARPGGASASAQPGPEGAGGRARSTRARGQWAESAAALRPAALTLLRMFSTSTPRLKAIAK